MPRSGDEAKRRLVQAAIELFARDGYDGTTAAEIAARAGVTERTFFRHFPDKREALFAGEQLLSDAIVEAIRKVPPGIGPIETLRRSFAGVVPMLEANRRYSEPRQRIIAANPALREREAAKHAVLVESAAAALAARGIEPRRAELATQTGLAVFGYGLDAWFAEPGSRLADHFDRGFAELAALANWS